MLVTGTEGLLPCRRPMPAEVPYPKITGLLWSTRSTSSQSAARGSERFPIRLRIVDLNAVKSELGNESGIPAGKQDEQFRSVYASLPANIRYTFD
jgi:hypothetical protein